MIPDMTKDGHCTPGSILRARMAKERDTGMIEEERRTRRDRRSNERRLDERRTAGIGEIIPERRGRPRRLDERRDPAERRD